MSANISDYFNKASNMNGSYPPVATVSSARAVGGATLSCNDLAGWTTDTPVHFSTFKVSADGTIDTTTQTDWKGIVVGNTITEMTRLAGAADSGNASGDKVELNPTIGWLNDLITGILVAHKQNGALKDSSVTSSSIATSAVAEAKIASNAVTTAKVKDKAITSAKIDFATLGGNYSTTEQSTGFTWIDGKKVYQKVISVNGNIQTFRNHNITNLGTVVKVTFIAQYPNGEQRLIPWLYTDANGWGSYNWAGGFYITSTQIVFQGGTSLAATSKYHVIIEYTKTS